MQLEPLPPDFEYPDISRWLLINHPEVAARYHGKYPRFNDPRTGISYFYLDPEESGEPTFKDNVL